MSPFKRMSVPGNLATGEAAEKAITGCRLAMMASRWFDQFNLGQGLDGSINKRRITS